MNTTPRSCPGLLSLYWRDFTIKYAVHACVMGLLLAVGIQWASQPVSPAQPPVAPSVEAALADKVSLGALVLAALALIVLLRRYLWVRKVLSQGDIVKGTVEEIDVYSRRTDNHTQTTFKPTYTHSYYVTVRFGMLAMEKKVRLKLPHSAFTYGMVKDGETDLIVHESAPEKPLLHAVYLGRF